MSIVGGGKHYAKGKEKGIIKFLLFSFVGVFYFFVPIFSGKTLLMLSISAIKTAVGDILTTLIIFLIFLFCILLFINPSIGGIKKNISESKVFNKILYVIGLVFGIIILFQIGPHFIIQKDTGGLALSLAADVFITVFIAGAMVTFISSFGLLQFAGIILEPLMKPLYRLPGYAGIDIATSITTSPAVDIYLSNKIYLQKMYTKREVSYVVTNFSICSLGFYVVLCEMAGITQYYGQVVFTSLLLSFIIPLITVRIPPLSRIPDRYVDDTIPVRSTNKEDKGIFKKAWTSAIQTADRVNLKEFLNGLIDSAFFAVKVACYILSIATIALIVSAYTPLFQWIGIPITPILELFRVPNAAEIAPATLIGITELALPTLLIADKAIAPAASFFVVVLSTLQIIFFAESANAIMESKIPLKAWKLIVIFLIRTAIAIPLVAIVMHLIF